MTSPHTFSAVSGARPELENPSPVWPRALSPRRPWSLLGLSLFRLSDPWTAPSLSPSESPVSQSILFLLFFHTSSLMTEDHPCSPYTPTFLGSFPEDTLPPGVPHSAS